MGKKLSIGNVKWHLATLTVDKAQNIRSALRTFKTFIKKIHLFFQLSYLNKEREISMIKGSFITPSFCNFSKMSHLRWMVLEIYKQILLFTENK